MYLGGSVEGGGGAGYTTCKCLNNKDLGFEFICLISTQSKERKW